MEQMIRLATYAMGTRFEILLSGDDAVGVRAAGEEALALIEECDRQFSIFERDSLISHINRIAHRRPVRLDADTFAMFRVCLAVHEESGGAFDVTVGPLMEELGFRGDSEPAPAGGPARVDIGSEWIELDEEDQTIHFVDGKRLKLDLGGVAKGHALDLARQSLVGNGVTSALLHGGTSGVVTIGCPVQPGFENPDGWRVAIRSPDKSKEARYSRCPSVALKDSALSVSAQHGRVAPGADGTVRGHVIDPRGDGTVSPADIVMTAVIGSSACQADAWSTALLVTGSTGMCSEAFGKTGMTGLICRPEVTGDEVLPKWALIGSDGGTWQECVRIPEAIHSAGSPADAVVDDDDDDDISVERE
ncbi:MAG: FAD:protein FMN transferase [Planctomycetes bacterium]|nr:FAD:protein FMN transferase [Planctomycetota bacterium]NOG52901.1 FAD:protein FMN transferase [Planctomycetota bacterium]